VLEESAILRVIERDVVVLDELAGFFWALEVQAMPVDDRAAREDQSKRFDVVEPKLLAALEGVARHLGPGAVARRRLGVG
jgi:hypothetical protein